MKIENLFVKSCDKQEFQSYVGFLFKKQKPAIGNVLSIVVETLLHLIDKFNDICLIKKILNSNKIKHVIIWNFFL